MISVTTRALKEVFTRPAYLLLAGMISVATFVASVLLPNYPLVFSVWGDASVSIGTKINLVFQLLGGITTNFSLLSATSTTLVALLFGMNLAMFIFYLKEKRGKITGVAVGSTFGLPAAASAQAGGLAAGVIGVGCAACGSFLLTAFLPVAGAGAILGFLPLEGRELGILAIILLAVSLVIISKQIAKVNTCDPAPEQARHGAGIAN